MKSIREWLLGAKHGGDPESTVKALEDAIQAVHAHEEAVLKKATPLDDLPPDVVADIDAETAEAIRDGRLLSADRRPFKAKVEVKESVQEAIDALPPGMRELFEDPSVTAEDVADMMITITKGEDPEDYPVADPKKSRPASIKMEWVKERTPGKAMTDTTFAGAAAMMAPPAPNAVESALAASQAENRENKRKMAAGGGAQDNKAFLALVNAVQQTIKEGQVAPNGYIHPGCNAPTRPNETIKGADLDATSDTPLKDSLPQFLRPEVNLRRMPDDTPARASIPFIRQVIELLREAFPDVKDKYWLVNEHGDGAGDKTVLVNILVRVSVKRDILVRVGPVDSEGFVRDSQDPSGATIDRTTLPNSSWPDFVGWVSLAKKLAESA